MSSTKKSLSEKKKNTIRISKKDLLRLLSHNESMGKKIVELEAKIKEMEQVIANAAAKALPTLEEIVAANKEVQVNFPEYSPPPPIHSHTRSDVYFDGSHPGRSGLRYGSKD